MHEPWPATSADGEVRAALESDDPTLYTQLKGTGFRSEMCNFSNPEITRIRPCVSAVYTTPGNDWPKLLYRFDDIMKRRHSSPIGHRDRDVTSSRPGDWSADVRGSLGPRSAARVPDRRCRLVQRKVTHRHVLFLLWAWRCLCREIIDAVAMETSWAFDADEAGLQL